ncbi:ribonuclease E inhibitor RraB [Pseudogemmobacter bohemicus]|uniref:ribonuclease E inhibitor RraB n=1 Tax=Pseudogemmobacter bohemicus TaxID=2250708 RepID=UPI000DD381E8|nr:ribonuclease E inhibitor RraB [Pseudogemmobacter bohemicus]
MLKKIVSLLLGLFPAAHPAPARTALPADTGNDHWMTYDRATGDGQPLVVLTRTGNARAGALLENGQASVVICEADPQTVGERGMPIGTARLYALEDIFAGDPGFLATGALHIASVTGQGQRRIYLVHPGALELTPWLAGFQVQGFTCQATPVEDRPALIALITPTRVEAQLNGDQSVMASLQKHGDDGSATRNTDFWFYGERLALDLVAAGLAPHGFTVNDWTSDPPGVILSRDMPVTWPEFQWLTPILVGVEERTGTEYSGWETMVVRPPA